MGVKERIFLFLENQSISKAEFERRAKLSNGYLNNFKGAFGAEKLEYILTAFPNLNKVWLLTGEGEMLNPSVIQNNQNGHNINGHSVKVEQKTDGKSSVSCPLKPSDSAPLKHSTMPP